MSMSITERLRMSADKDLHEDWYKRECREAADCIEALETAARCVVPAEGALRYNSGKPRYDLLPPDALNELAEVFTKGAEKYAPRNWEKGMDWGKCFASLLRHAFKWAKGEDRDEETGCLHMAHVAWNALVLCSYAMRKVGTDDRSKL